MGYRSHRNHNNFETKLGEMGFSEFVNKVYMKGRVRVRKVSNTVDGKRKVNWEVCDLETGDRYVAETSGDILKYIREKRMT